MRCTFCANGSCLRMQVGCPMRCTFCATGKGGFARNLRQHEIIDQVMTVQERMGARVSNVGEAPPDLTATSNHRSIQGYRSWSSLR